MARDYSKGKIYCIKVNTEEEYLPYVGSTTKQYLSQRIEKHRGNYKQWKKGKGNFISSYILFDKYGVENCYIELLELYPCKCSEELRKKERFWFDKMNCCNKLKPFISKEENVEYDKIRKIEYNKLNPEKSKEYYVTHKEEILEKAKIYYETHKEQITEKDKIYYDKHKELILEKKKEYHQKNKEKISIQRKETYECQCGSICRKHEKARHEKSKKHQKYLTTISTHATITESS